MSNQRRVRPQNEDQNDSVSVEIEDAVIASSDITGWVLVGDTWVDAARIITVGPLANIWDEKQGAEGIPEPTGGVAVQIDSPHSDSQFVQSHEDSVDEIMSRVIEATTD